MKSMCKCKPREKYTFEEIGEFIFEKSWEISKGTGVNISLVNKMMGEFEAEWDSETDKMKVVVIQGLYNINFKANEIKNLYRITPIFG